MATLMRRYGAGARWYDVLSGEKWVYRAGREAGIRLLRPRRGDTVIDLGCGTGLNFSGLLAAVGPEGRVIGIDRSVDMLAVARRRVEAMGWHDCVRLVPADAATLDPGDVVALTGGRGADAVFSTYALSVMPAREEAWRRVRAAVRPGGRAGIVDMQRPHGRWRALEPLALLACATGGADIDAHPWRLLERDAVDPGAVERAERKGGHLVAVAADLGAAITR
ncbi:ubiquinone/menaquinone biosynthesis C-methylase UbiE [Microbacterium proteolyticum]|uniref:Ubiquinone/menaquinone biosynthesis C-methylase UbiE n=1 Tax=Microbacterium proteolyticum TaxID=1572644 RepID=A0A7W5CGT1_9MICO|nr:methyltransferase domain-containing protein [Microbacterium proteolyticum]MBB3157357.1 ubiquinone/menaquinone biosynthesis C-methylase UbiE [Microbacterium proteolyticum]